VTDANVPSDDGAAELSSSLLVRVKARDREAWERLVRLYGPLVFRWCRQAGVPAADTPDVGQEVFLAVARKVQDFRRDRAGDSFRAWIRTITRHKVFDFHRARRDEVVAAGGSDALTSLHQAPTLDHDEDSDASEAEETTLLYQRALELIRDEFEERTWQAFWRVAVEEQRPPDVAAALGMTPNAVYLARSRVVRRLRQEFADLVDPC
jgi:RNA polymerase sigma-70 factor (ECF subfamily)